MTRVRVRIGSVTIDGRDYPGSAFDGREGSIIHDVEGNDAIGVDDEGLFAIVALDGIEGALRFGLRSLEMLGAAA